MFIPIGDDNSWRRTTPFVVYCIVAANLYVWYLQLRWGESFTASFAAVPFELSHGIDLTTTNYITLHGERVPIPQAPGPDPIYLTIFTSIFMHGSWLHLLGNMLYLIIFGDQIEDRLGHRAFILFYLSAGIAASLAQVVADPNSTLPCIGASGAIAGVLGAYLVLYPHNRVKAIFIRQVVIVPAILVLGMWGVLQLLGQASVRPGEAGVAYMAHLGGLVTGMVVGFGVRLFLPRSSRY